jgi:hypothetical protein
MKAILGAGMFSFEFNPIPPWEAWFLDVEIHLVPLE